MHAIHHQRGPAYLRYIVQFNTAESDVASSVPPRLMQLLLCGRVPSSGSAPSQSAVQVFGTRFPHTSETFILLQLFAKLLRLICVRNSIGIVMHCRSSSMWTRHYNIHEHDYDYYENA